MSSAIFQQKILDINQSIQEFADICSLNGFTSTRSSGNIRGNVNKGKGLEFFTILYRRRDSGIENFAQIYSVALVSLPFC